MLLLKGSRTEENMKSALADEVRSHRRYVTYARTAEAAGQLDLAAQLRTTADGAASHAVGHLHHLVGDDEPPVRDAAGTMSDALMTAATASTEATAAMYAGMARTAHEEGFDDIAEWFETLARAGHSSAQRLRRVAATPRHNGRGFD